MSEVSATTQNQQNADPGMLTLMNLGSCLIYSSLNVLRELYHLVRLVLLELLIQEDQFVQMTHM